MIIGKYIVVQCLFRGCFGRARAAKKAARSGYSGQPQELPLLSLTQSWRTPQKVAARISVFFFVEMPAPRRPLRWGKRVRDSRDDCEAAAKRINIRPFWGDGDTARIARPRRLFSGAGTPKKTKN